MGTYDTDEFLDSVDRERPVPWEIVMSVNGMVCDCCQEVMYPWRDGICEAHTHGLKETYNHPDFQTVIETDDIEDIWDVLDEMACRVRAGARYNPGDIVESLIEGRLVRCEFQIDMDALMVLRLVITDGNGYWPEDEGCDELYSLQMAPTPLLRNLEDVRENLQREEELE